MPTVLRVAGLRVVIYPNDHRPTHVLVIGGDGEAAFNPHCPQGPLELRESFRFSRARLHRIAGALDETLAALCRDWERIHGGF